jgi:hypothetical protein
MGKFWDGVVGGIARKWSDRLLSPAFVFWLAGAYLCGRSLGWDNAFGQMNALSTPLQILVLVVALLVVAGSATAIESVQEGMLHLMEGYWPRWMGVLRRWRVGRQKKRRDGIKRQLAALAERWEHLSPEEMQAYTRLDAEWRAYPHTYSLLPTRLGNLLRAAEEHPDVRYGLVAGVVWPHLWLVLPDNARKDISEARERLNAAVRLCIWGLLFLVWLPCTLSGPHVPLPPTFGLAWISVAVANVLTEGWPFFVGVGLAYWGYRRALAAAQVYGDLLRAAFDLYRDDLFDELGWPMVEDRKKSGQALTQFLWRG